MTTRPRALSLLVGDRSPENEPPPGPGRSTASVDGSFRSFLAEQVRALAPFDFVLLSVPASPTGFEVVREEDGNLRVRLVAQPPEALSELQRAALDHLGFQAVTQTGIGTAWERLVVPSEADGAAGVAEAALAQVFAVEPGAALDLRHGNASSLRHDGECWRCQAIIDV
jgi:hypothetical protein